MSSGKRRTAWVLAVCALAILPAMRAAAFPEPAIVSPSWQFDFSHGRPQLIGHTIDGATRWYWYMTYKVVNNTDQERLLVPELTMATDAGDILTAGRSVAPGLFKAIKQRTRNILLQEHADIVGQILLGEDNAREGVAIWEVPSHDVDRLTIFVAGLSGETQSFKNPASDEQVVVRKTLMIEFSVPGTPPRMQDQHAELLEEIWIMR